MQIGKRDKTYSIRLTVMSIFIGLSLLIASASVGSLYYFSRSTTTQAALQQYSHIAENVSERIKSLDRESAELAYLLKEFKDLGGRPNVGRKHPAMKLMTEVMKLNPQLYALYVGYGDNDFYEVVNLESSPQVRELLKADQMDRWVTIKVLDTPDGRQRVYEYYDSSFNFRYLRREQSDYLPTERPWFVMAQFSDGLVKTPPYLFHHLQAPGVTYALSFGEHVLCVDISLESMSHFLRQQLSIPSSRAFLFDQEGVVTASSDRYVLDGNASSYPKAIEWTKLERDFLREHPVISGSNAMDHYPIDYSEGGAPKGYSIDVLRMVEAKTGLKFEFLNGYSTEQLLKLYREGRIDFLQSFVYSEKRKDWGHYSQPYLTLPFGLVVRKTSEKPALMLGLSESKVAVPKGGVTTDVLHNYFPTIEVEEVGKLLDALKLLQSGEVDAVLDYAPILNSLLSAYQYSELELVTDVADLDELNHDIWPQNLHLLVRPDAPELASIFNKALDSISEAQWQDLKQKWFGRSGVSASDGNSNSNVVPAPDLLLQAQVSLSSPSKIRKVQINNRQHFSFVAPMSSLYGQQEFLGILVREDALMAPAIKRVNQSVGITLAVLLLLIPFVHRFSVMIVRPVNRLAVENEKIKRRKFDEVQPINSRITELQDLANSMFGMSAAINRYQSSQNRLIDGVIQLIAESVDEKSPFTGNHCAKVPLLAISLAEAASESNSEQLKSFKFSTPDEKRAFQVAAWLHDCGKLTTPDHIVDKGTKLECVYNRIHEIRTRFEVLWRDAEIEFWIATVEKVEAPSQIEAKLKAKHKQLKEDFEFIASMNLASEWVDEHQLERLNRIADQTWSRHFDRNLGLSPVELKGVKDKEEQLPVVERLLTDRAEHLTAWRTERDYEEQLGIQTQAPEFESNKGELYNLSIRKGTLTDEERYIINEHVINTIKMLNTLPWPADMARVPEYAGGHHEKLNGTGYPRGLSQSQLSIPARILAIADVFEALTADDRPYQKGLVLSEALKVMYDMVLNGELDKDLFDLFIESGSYFVYANQFMGESRIDTKQVNYFLIGYRAASKADHVGHMVKRDEGIREQTE